MPERVAASGLSAALASVHAVLAAAVAGRRSEGSEPTGLHGLVVGASDVDRALAAFLAAVPRDEWGGGPEPTGVLGDVAGRFGLDLVDLRLLVLAVAPDVVPGCDKIYGYLHDDVTQRRASVGLALELAGCRVDDATARARLTSSGRLVAAGLLAVDDAERPFLGRGLRVPDAVTSYLLGGDDPDPAVAELVTPLVATPLAGHADIASALAAGVPVAWVVQAVGSAGGSLASAALSAFGVDVLAIDLSRLPTGATLERVLVPAARDAALRGCGLVVLGVEPERDRAAWGSLDRLACPVVLVSDVPWNPAWAQVDVFVTRAPATSPEIRGELWRKLVAAADTTVDPGDVDQLIRGYHLTPEQIVGAVAAASALAAGDGAPINVRHLRAGARAQNSSRLDRLATHIEPRVSLAHLVLPAASHDQLREVVDRVHHREQVYERWAMGRPGGGRAPGVKCLLAGPPGTGKTISAEAVAHELSVDLYAVDLSQVVDKYVGETEKNLDRIFAAAAGINAVLFFDEADALFGKRSEVRGAQDRYANVEVSYLLQKMDQFDGVAMLATNRLANFDEAFMRRLDVIVRYTLPDEHQRAALWRAHLPPELPLAGDVDVDLLAAALELPGALIAAACTSAAFAAAASGRSVGMADLVAAASRLFIKEGRLVRPETFGEWAFAASSSP